MGGTYILQVRAKNEREAIHEWLDKVDTEEVYGMGEKSRANMKRELAEKELDDWGYVAINECKNVWYDRFSLQGGTGVLHIILTKENIQ
jgi:hypothetical protein